MATSPSLWMFSCKSCWTPVVMRQLIYHAHFSCALFGGFTVLSTKALSGVLSSIFLDALRYPTTWFLILVLVVTSLQQIRFLNKALQNFESRVSRIFPEFADGLRLSLSYFPRSTRRKSSQPNLYSSRSAVRFPHNNCSALNTDYELFHL